jgi:hypothetical protein
MLWQAGSRAVPVRLYLTREIGIYPALSHNTSNRLSVKRGGTRHAAGVGL